MSGLYDAAMRRGAAILFLIAAILFVSGLLLPFLMSDEARGIASTLPYGSGSFGLSALLGALGNALSAAVWPFFGAAILWRIDRMRPPVGASGQ